MKQTARNPAYPRLAGQYRDYLTLQRTGDLPEAANVASTSFGIIRFGETDQAWVVSTKGEVEYWSKSLEQFAAAAVVAVLAIIIFLPCLCLVPFMFAVDETKVAASAEKQFRAPMERVRAHFR